MSENNTFTDKTMKHIKEIVDNTLKVGVIYHY